MSFIEPLKGHIVIAGGTVNLINVVKNSRKLNCILFLIIHTHTQLNKARQINLRANNVK